MRLEPKPSTTIHPVGQPPRRRLKWCVVEDDGKPLTTLQGHGKGYSYLEHPDETAMLKKLKPLFCDYEIASIPDPHNPQMALYEARQHVPIDSEPPLQPETVTVPKKAIETNLVMLND